MQAKPIDSSLYELKLHPLNDEYIGVIDIMKLPSSSTLPKAKCETVIVLDRSGSMGDNIPYIIQKILPEFFKELGYKSDEIIHLITFDTVVEYLNPTVGNLKSLNIKCQGGTYMSQAIIKLQQLLEIFKREKIEALRILSISDGEILDKRNVLKLSEELAKCVKNFDFSINSQAVRFFTSEHGQPDTTAMCCLLQLNECSVSNLLDISSKESFDVIIDEWTELFANDYYGHAVKLKCNSQIIRRNPWELRNSDRVRLMTGNNVFWFKEVPSEVKINGCGVKVTVESSTSYEKFHSILKEKLRFIMDHMKILKIIQTEGKNQF